MSFLVLVACWACLLLTVAGTARARQIVDMAGRTVEVPDKITRVYGATPPALYLLYAMAPETIVGLNFPPNDLERPYMRKDVRDLPVIGGWFGQGRTPNLEYVMSVHPDIMLVWYYKETATNELVERTAKSIGVPLVYVRLDTLEDYARSFRFLGDLLGKPERGEALAAYTERTLAGVHDALQSLPEDQRTSVYYAEGRDGLKTECSGSTHAVLIGMAGGRNVQQCISSSMFGMEPVSMEQVLNMDPAVILVQDWSFFKEMPTMPQWGAVRAVREGHVYAVPRQPFNWFDRPPSFMRILGVQWLTHLLYPDRYPWDSVRATREFYHLFLYLDLSDEQIQSILHP